MFIYYLAWSFKYIVLHNHFEKPVRCRLLLPFFNKEEVKAKRYVCMGGGSFQFDLHLLNVYYNTMCETKRNETDPQMIFSLVV